VQQYMTPGVMLASGATSVAADGSSREMVEWKRSSMPSKLVQQLLLLGSDSGSLPIARPVQSSGDCICLLKSGCGTRSQQIQHYAERRVFAP